MNITISIDKKTTDRARAVAKRQGMSLQTLLRKYLESVAGVRPGGTAADELLELMQTQGGHSGGKPFDRADAYEGRV